MSTSPIRVVVWDENPSHAPRELYPENIRGAVAAGLREIGNTALDVRVAHLDESEQGVPAGLLAETDVLLWWGHVRHGEVTDDTVERVARRVCDAGMGFIGLHSAHYSRTLQRILGCTGHLKGGWREDNQPEQIRVCAPNHPIVADVDDFVLDEEEMYGAPFDVPPAAVTILQSYFPVGGEYFPSGLAWTVGKGIDPDFESGPGQGVGQGEGAGRVFYFRPGHEGNPTYYHPSVKRILCNAVMWAARRT